MPHSLRIGSANSSSQLVFFKAQLLETQLQFDGEWRQNTQGSKIFADHFNRARLVVGSDLAYLIKSSKLNNNVSVRVSQIDPSTLTCVPLCTSHSPATEAFAND